MRARLAIFAPVACVLALLVAGIASAADTDRNGYEDFLIREPSYLAYPNAGMQCSGYYAPNGGIGVWNLIYVRPPRVWSLWGLSNQTVAWRARLVYPGTNVTIPGYVGPWKYSAASPNQPTDFGGGSSYPVNPTSGVPITGSSPRCGKTCPQVRFRGRLTPPGGIPRAARGR